MLGHGLGHVWQFGSLILTIIKILKLELLQYFFGLIIRFLKLLFEGDQNNRLEVAHVQTRTKISGFSKTCFTSYLLS